MSSETFTPQDRQRLQVDLWIGGHKKGTPEWEDEYQAFPAEGCRVPTSPSFPGLIIETLRYSWCFIAYLLPGKAGEERQWHITYRRNIDERARARKIRKDREGRQQY